jgi:hypothetical protein
MNELHTILIIISLHAKFVMMGWYGHDSLWWSHKIQIELSWINLKFGLFYNIT